MGLKNNVRVLMPWKRKTITIVENKDESYSYGGKVALFVMAVVEAFIFGGTSFGWSSIVYVYEQEGIYSHLCQNHTAAM